MTFPFSITYKNGKQNTVWVDAETETDANEYSLNYWSDPEVTGVEPFIETDDNEHIPDCDDDSAELAAQYGDK